MIITFGRKEIIWIISVYQQGNVLRNIERWDEIVVAKDSIGYMKGDKMIVTCVDQKSY